jgi:hypothetical protein
LQICHHGPELLKTAISAGTLVRRRGPATAVENDTIVAKEVFKDRRQLIDLLFRVALRP